MTIVLLKGQPASPGTVRGHVQIVEPFCNVAEVEFMPGSILVTKYTTPLLTILLLQAKAIVTDVGGVTCHAASIAREMGIPCVVGTREATRKLRNGMVVQVDGDKGLVYDSGV